MRFFLLFILFLNFSCGDEKGPIDAQESRNYNNYPLPKTVPVTNPITVLTDTCPAPRTVVIPTAAVNKTIKLPNGETIKIAPPEKRVASSYNYMRNYKVEEGLALNSINCGYKDKKGNLWFGTNKGGVSRYDGKSFTNFTTTQGLINNLVYCITEDKKGNIWIGTLRGLSCYDGKSFRNYTIADGLPHNEITTLLGDRSGNLWIGTWDAGIACYDGKLFTHYTTKDGLVTNSVKTIVEDKAGNLWIGTNGGVSKWAKEHFKSTKKHQNSFTNYTVAQGLISNYVSCIIEDKKGNIWLGTYGGLSRYDGKTFTNYTAAKDGLVGNFINCITIDTKGNLWFGSYSNGISRLDEYQITTAGIKSKKQDRQNTEAPDTTSLFTNYTRAQGLADNDIRCIMEDNNANFWFGTYGKGVSQYTNEAFVSYTIDQGLINHNIRGITEDREGNIWFGTINGELIRYDGLSFLNFSTASTQGLLIHPILAIATDRTGNLWLSTMEGGAICYNGKSIKCYGKKQGLPSEEVNAIIQDTKGNFWFGTAEGVSKYDGKFFTNFSKAQGLVSNYVNSIVEDNKGNIWFATEAGVSKYDGNIVEAIEKGENIPESNLRDLKRINGKFIKSFTNFTVNNGLVNNTVLNIKKDHLGSLWFSTENGVSRYDGKSFLNFTAEHGLASNNAYGGIAIDKQNNIWIGTNLGISKLNFKSKKTTLAIGKPETEIIKDNKPITNEELKAAYNPVFETYNFKNGYPVNEIMLNSLFIDSTGKLWACTGDKLLRFDYNCITKNNRSSNVYIQSIKINNENICWHDLNSATDDTTYLQQQVGVTVPTNLTEESYIFGRSLTEQERETMRAKFKGIKFSAISPFYPLPENLKLPYEHNSITFDFSAIEPSRFSLIHYQYMLEGYDPQWSPVTNKTSATYGNIYEGKYTFKLKAKTPEGIWSEPTVYTFKVLPPWYRSWWAYSSYIGIAAGLLFILFQWRTAALLKDKNLLEQKVKERTAEAVLQKEKAEQSAKVKEEFLSNMSHEIRTPLSAIAGYAELSLKEKSAEKIKKNLQAVKLASDHLRTLVDDILDFSKIESGKLRLHKTDFDLQEVIEEVKLLLHFKALEGENTINSNLSGMITPFIYGDKNRLIQVLINLLDNAVKFTKNGKIDITVQQFEQTDEKTTVLFEIKDTGIGIPANKLETIFESFTQAENNMTRKYRGTGLGLTISKKIIELQGGHIHVTSIENKGTVFSFQLPYAKGKKTLTINENKVRTTNPTGLRLLVAEDDTVNQDLLSQILHQWNMDADFAATGEKLIELLHTNTYNLILLDIHMPGMSGFEVTEIIRTNFDSPFKDIPIIALTADVIPATREKIVNSGINDYVYKPIDTKILHEKIGHIFNINAKPPGNTEIEKAWSIKTQHFNLNYLLNNYGTNKKYMLDVLAKSNYKLKEYKDALLTANKRKNAGELLFFAHRLKTIAGILGITCIQNKLSALHELVISEQSFEKIDAELNAIDQDTKIANKEIARVIEYILKNQLL